MKSIKLSFADSEIVIDTNSYVEGLDATIQNGIVNIATRQGTDAIYPKKGTVILKNAVAGKIAGMNDANHEAQLAGINTLFFSREYETSKDGKVKLGSVEMAPVTYNGKTLVLTVAFTDADKTRTVGTTTIL